MDGWSGGGGLVCPFLGLVWEEFEVEMAGAFENFGNWRAWDRGDG